MELYIVFAALASTRVLADSGPLQCYICQNVTDVNLCNQAVTCAANQACYMESMTLANAQKSYTMSCRENSECSKLSSSIHLVGRSPDGPVRTISSTNDHICQECCSTPLCNKAICNHTRPSACIDDPSIDCARISSIFNVCDDIHKAKMVCPKFCKLCNIVDGNWDTWSNWSGCDVTCGNGTRTRDRTCSNPAPENGGLDCVGNSRRSETCSLANCPIHGGWSQWSPWGSCSVTCDVGMQRRDRSCSNPYPALGGDHCFGDARDDRICYESACSNGGWASWEPWESCSTTCSLGLRTRNRACNNPLPSLLGRYCDGPPQVTDLCSNTPCSERPKVAFSAYLNLSYTYSNSPNHTIQFENVVLNEGYAYSPNNGVFRVPVSGVYMFTAALGSRFSHRQWFNIVADGHILSTIVYFPAALDQHAMGTNVVLVRLNRSQRVWVEVDSHDSGESLQGDIRTSTFSGLFLYD